MLIILRAKLTGMGCPDIWLNIILDVAVGVFLNEINI